MNRTGTIHNTLSSAACRESYDIRSIITNKSQPPAERIQDYLREIGDPYHFSVGSMNVMIRFNGKRSLTDCLADALMLTAY